MRDEFWNNVRVMGENEQVNQSLERAGRVADFLGLAELLCIDALHRTESCGAHFRVESQTLDGEAVRDDEHFAYVAAWQSGGEGKRPAPAQGAPLVRQRAVCGSELQVMRLTLKVWRQKNAA